MPRRVRPQAQIAGAREAGSIAATLGESIRTERRRRRLTIVALSDRTGLSRSRIAEIERGDGVGAPLGVWVALGIAIDRPLAVGLSQPLGVDRSAPADAGHLEIQEFLLGLARANGRRGTFELPTRPADPLRSTDVGVRDSPTGTRILQECWNTFGDLGAAVRATHRKHAEAAATWPDDRITTVWVVRASAGNRRLISRYPHIVAAAFPGSSRAWLRALTTGAAPPAEPGLVWFDPATRRLTEWRRGALPSAP